MSTVSAATRVFGLPELLELILLNTAPVDLFAMRRVNHTFLNTLNSYASLRARMYRELGGWDISSLHQTITDPRLEEAIFPFHILRLSRRPHKSSSFKRYILSLTLNETWIRENQNTPVRNLFTNPLLRNVEGSWGLIGVTKPHRAFKVELSVAGKHWGSHSWTCPGDDSLRLYEVVHKCMHIVSRGWKKGWQIGAIEQWDAHPHYRKYSKAQMRKVMEEIIEERKKMDLGRIYRRGKFGGYLVPRLTKATQTSTKGAISSRRE